jgi:serine/threonine protein kinase
MTEILQTGSTLGRYRLMQRIGIGGMAEVFLGVQAGAAGFQRQVAIKVLLPGDQSEQLIESLVTEAQLAAQLAHPNIVQVIDFGVHGEGFFLVMEYLNGWPLENVIRTARKQRATIPLDVLADVSLQVLDALAFAHEATDGDGTHLEVIHRDIKPANMMVLPMGLLKLVDFGIAKAATIERRTVTGMAKGTPSYMAPEQLRGHDVGPGADIYALAVSLFEMAVGKPLFTADSFIELMARRLRPVGPEDLKFLDAVYPELTPIVGRGLATDPAERWPDANSMATALRDLVSITPRQPLKRWLKELKMEQHRPLTQSGMRIGGTTEPYGQDSNQAPVHGTESIERRVTQPAPGDAALLAKSVEQHEVPPTRAQGVAPEVPPTRAQFIEPEVPPTRAQYVDPPAAAPTAAKEEGEASGTVFQTRLPTGPTLSTSEPAPATMATSGKRQGLSSKKIVLFLGLFCLVSALAFTALGNWIWSSWTDEGGDTAVPVTAQRVEPSATDQPQRAAEVPEGKPGKTEPAKAAKRKIAKPEPSNEAAARPRRVKGEPRAAAKQPTKKVAKERTKKAASEPTKRAAEVEPTKRAASEPTKRVAEVEPTKRVAEVERMPTPVFDGRNPFAGMPGLGGTSLGFPSLEGFPGLAGSLEVRVIGGTGWTFGISGRGTRRTGRAFSKLPPGPMEVEIFDASGHKRGHATVVVIPGEASECTWRVEGETLRFVGGNPCTKL